MSNHIQNQSEHNPKSEIYLIESGGMLRVWMVSLCLVLASTVANGLLSSYLSKAGDIKSWNRAVHYSDTVAGVFLVIEMAVAVFVFGIPLHKVRIEALKRLLLPTSIKPLLWGSFIGIAVYVAALPLLLLFDEHAQFVRLLLNDPFSLQSIFLVGLLGLLVPITTEIVFRGIIFDLLVRNTNTVIALVVSSLLFAYVWTPFNAGMALLLGIACGLLYRRFHSLVPCIVCSGIATLAAVATIFCRVLFRG